MISKEVQTGSKKILNSKEDIAIIGMSCLYPKAHDVQTFWQNIVTKVDAITEVDPEIWDPDVFYSPDPNAGNKVYSKRGGFLKNITKFNPLKYGIMPIVVEGGEPDQFMSVRLAYDALDDAGYLDKPFDEKKTEVILGKGNYTGPGIFNVFQHMSGMEQVLRIIKKLNPDFSEDALRDIRAILRSGLPRLGFENATSIIPNMLTGRACNRLNLMGVNYTVDAACASALIATEIGMSDLKSGKCNLVLVGGSHMFMAVIFLSILCRLRAMSLTSDIRPFDKDADGMLHGEGAGIFVLKRLEDAERDGDRIYAVIKGIGSSSDGKATSVVAPRVEGEELALRRAYESSGIDPSTIELIEGHGTATTVGDAAELECLRRVFGEKAEDMIPRAALGSVKSMIGHTMPAAGAASLIKTALALYHKILPPTLNCEEPNPKINWSKSNIYVNTETRPWIHGYNTPRRAAVNAFGFGGVNAHVILEEYIPPDAANGLEEHETLWHEWDSEVLILQGESRQAIIQKAQQLQKYLKDVDSAEIAIKLRDLAYTLNSKLEDGSKRLSIIASSLDDLQEKLEYSLKRLSNPENIRIKYIKGVFYFDKPLAKEGKLAFLFPGEGSQYLNMLSDLCMHFPDAREVFDLFDEFAIKHGDTYLPSQIVFPPPAFSESERKEYEERLWKLEGALQAVLASDRAIDHILTSIGIVPDMILGHSSGELVAMASADISLIDDQLFQSIYSVHNLYKNSEVNIPKAIMVATGAGRDTVSAIVDAIGGNLYVAMDNCPHQVVVVGEEQLGEQFIDTLQKRNILYQKLDFDRAYHTPMFEEACKVVLEQFKNCHVKQAEIPLYSCTTMTLYPDDPQDIIKLAAEHWERPVEFRKTIETMYEDGARIFVEVGPNGNLTAFVDDILRGKEYLAFPANTQRHTGIMQLNHLVGILAAHGLSMQLDYFYKRRSPRLLSLDVLEDKKILEGGTEGLMELSLKFPELKIGKYLKPEKNETIEEKPSPKIAPDIQHPVTTDQPHPDPAKTDSNISQYLQTMEHFLQVQNEVMSAYLNSGAQSFQEPEFHQPSLPFIGEIISYIPNQQIEIVRHVSLDEDIFLLDHTFGGRISVDESLFPMPIIPMTVSVETMAEVASLLLPGKVLVEMRKIQAIQWIKVELDNPATIHISAKMQDPVKGEVSVEIRNLSENIDKEPSQISPIVKSIMVFNDSYPQAPEIREFKIDGAGPCKKNAKQLYEEYMMFHGPRFQGVVSLNRSGENGIEADLQVMATDEFIRSDQNPQLLTDPALIDAAGQVVGYWALEQLKTKQIVFPIGIDSLKIYGPNRPVGERVKCQASLRLLNSSFLNMDVDIIDAKGNLWMEISGWRDWRFNFSDKAVMSGRFPNRIFMSASFNEMLSMLELFSGFNKNLLECYIYDSDYMDKVDSFWMEVLAHRFLNHQERSFYKTLNWPVSKKYDWLYARIGAKDAVRAYVTKHYELELYPADVGIENDEYGKPLVRGYWEKNVRSVPTLSLSHSNGIAVAITGEIKFLGIDIEKISQREPSFEKMAFTDKEREILGTFRDTDKINEMQTRFWCAKEVVAKALGYGLENPLDLSALDYQERFLDPKTETGVIKMTLRGKLAEKFPEFAASEITVCTTRYKDFIIAATARE